MKRRIALSFLVGTSASIALPSFAQSANRIVLGQSAPFTGNAAQLGLQVNTGAKIFFAALNASGGVNGQYIDLQTLDDSYDPDQCRANTDQFIRQDLFGLFGYVGTPTSLAALPLVLESKIPFFAPVTGAEALRTPLQKQVFHVRASYFDETAAIVKQLITLGMKKVAVFYQNDAYGQAGLDGVKRALMMQGLEPVALGTVERNSVDVTKAVKEILSKNPNAVVQIGAYKSCAQFIKDARKAGYGGTLINVSFVGTQALADALGAEGQGVSVSQVMPYPFAPTTAIAREYLDAVAKVSGAQPNYSSIEGYVAAKVFAEGLRRAPKNPSRDAVVTALESMQNVDLGGFRVNFSPSNHVASHYVDLSMLTESGRVRH